MLYRNVSRMFRTRVVDKQLAQPKRFGGNSIMRYFLGLSAAAAVSATVYDSTNEFEYVGGASRFLRSLKIAVVISADYSWTLFGLANDSQEYTKVLKEVNQRSAERLLQGCLANGGLYIKIGQGISAINHILPKEYTSTLCRLENECLPRKPDEVKRLFREEFGKEPEEMYAKFDYEPVAAASLAQVFRATTLDGDEVAVKVQYIDLQKRFSGDFGTIQFLQSIVKSLHKNYNFGWILNDLRGNLEQELDFVHEGQNAEQCAKDMRKFDFIHVPTVRWDLTSTRILTAEWCDGYKITDLKRIEADALNLHDIDQKLFTAFAEQIFSTGFVHADPHPGNVLVRKNRKGKPEIVLLDHGLYETLPAHVRHSLCQFWEAIVLKDVDKMKRYADELQVDDYDRLAEVLLQRPLDMGVKKLSTRLTEDELVYMQQMAKERFDTVLNTLKQMPRQMIFVIRNLNTIRAVARNHGDPIDRPVHMARYAQRCIRQYESGVLSPFRWLGRRVSFEWHLLRVSWSFWLLRTYMRVLTALNRAPDTKELFTNDYSE